ncbi:aspartate 1-decarboxylase [Actinophytocola xinjiangensis]|uniref:Aspartate 1-decarboxylase n=1 Tax=Actinophytocola xinjiangensis TaxID=485602 RepID=A0A7Z1AZC7_9PSEU|nr:aspartate 1-decarboxylase [Actinophytocola xinjiangensis]OLF11790.1 aspartate 1-decarboxylase [Actinophytocola xinjiangensis]
MDLTLMKSKIHRARVTQADLHYVGSLTICGTLLDAAGLYPGEKVDIVDIDNGARLSTYVIEGPPDTGVIGINGAAARLISPGDLVIIIAYAQIPVDQARAFTPRVVFVDEHNRATSNGHDPADAPDRSGLHRGDTVTRAV